MRDSAYAPNTPADTGVFHVPTETSCHAGDRHHPCDIEQEARHRVHTLGESGAYICEERDRQLWDIMKVARRCDIVRCCIIIYRADAYYLLSLPWPPQPYTYSVHALPTGL